MTVFLKASPSSFSSKEAGSLILKYGSIRINEHEDVRDRESSSLRSGMVALCFAATLAYIIVAASIHSSLRNSGRDNSKSSVSSSWDDNTYFLWEEFLMTNNNYHSKIMAQAKVSLLGQVSTKDEVTSLLYFNQSSAFARLNPMEDDFFRYQSGWEAQITQALCAVASTAALLNSLRDDSAMEDYDLPMDPTYVPFLWATQANILDPDDPHHGDCIVSAFGGRSNAEAVKHIGQGIGTLPKFANCFLEPNGYIAEGHHAQDYLEKELKAIVVAHLKEPHSRVLLNYDRGGIGQGPMGHGHWSPLGAYNEELDSFLIMDVAKYKHPMVWVSWEELWGGALTTDSCSTMLPSSDDDKPVDWKAGYLEIIKRIGKICQQGNRGFVVVRPIE